MDKLTAGLNSLTGWTNSGIELCGCVEVGSRPVVCGIGMMGWGWGLLKLGGRSYRLVGLEHNSYILYEVQLSGPSGSISTLEFSGISALLAAVLLLRGLRKRAQEEGATESSKKIGFDNEIHHLSESYRN